MPIFTITQTATGVVLFQGEASTSAQALDLMAQDAGYANFAEIPAEIGGRDTLLVEEGPADRTAA